MNNYNNIDSYENYTGTLEGSMNIPSKPDMKNIGQPDFNTLDEPIKVTIMRDLQAIWIKFKHVLQPKEKQSLLKEWDLWGPLVLCTFMAMILQSTPDVAAGDYHDGGPEFAEVFVMVWVGALIVTLNSKLLGGNISFFQSVCVLGYCLLPTTIALILCRIVLLFPQSTFSFFLRFIITMTGFGWATYGKKKKKKFNHLTSGWRLSIPVFSAQVSSSPQRTCTLYPSLTGPRNFASNSSPLPFLLTLLPASPGASNYVLSFWLSSVLAFSISPCLLLFFSKLPHSLLSLSA
ncbi:hypothetical protein PGB90_006366 [Kerria lacca]